MIIPGPLITRYSLRGELFIRLSVLLLVLGLIAITTKSIVQAKQSAISAQARAEQNTLQLRLLTNAVANFADLRQLEAKSQQVGIPETVRKANHVKISSLLSKGEFSAANSLISTSRLALYSSLAQKQQTDAALEAKLGSISGIISDTTGPLAGVTLVVSAAGQAVQTVTTDQSGSFQVTLLAGTYQLQATLAQYSTSTPLDVTIVALNLVRVTLSLNKIVVSTPQPTAQATANPTSRPVPAPTAVPSADSAPYSAYVHTSLHGHVADIMSFDLSSGHIRVMVDTANDTDCQTDCTVKSVRSFVEQNHGFAGINGSYFCPTAYGASCAGKTNSFYWKEYNSRLQRMINPNNTLGEQDPFMIFSASGHATLLQHWVQRPTDSSLYAGFSCNPLLIFNGQNVLQVANLDDKERTAYISRAAIALKGQILYSVVIQSATVPDLADALLALGVDGAINSDAGGSSGMFYNGAYRLGPGRDVPNALVFAEQ